MPSARLIALAALLLGQVALAQPAAPAVAGRWRLALPTGSGNLSFLIELTQTGDSWTGSVADTSTPLRGKAKVSDVRVAGDTVRLTLDLGGTPVAVEGRVSADGSRLLATGLFDGKPALLTLRPSKLKDFKDRAAYARELFEQADTDREAFDLGQDILVSASDDQADAAQIRVVIESLGRRAAGYGPRWQRETALGAARTLMRQKPYTAVAVEQARQAERLLTPGEPIAAQLEVVETLAKSLEADEKPADAAAARGRLAKLEARDALDYARSLPVPAEPFARKTPGKRVALVEFLTGVEISAGVGPTVGFDAARKHVPPEAAVFLAYHLPAGGADPLSTEAAEKRAKGFKTLETLPAVFVDGKPLREPGGPRGAAKARADAYVAAVRGALDKPAGATLSLAGKLEGDKLTLKARVGGVAKPGPKVRLRFVLLEERLTYPAITGLRYHGAVVRAFPGGADGFAVEKAEFEQTVEAKVTELRKEIDGYLDELTKLFARDGAAFPRPEGLSSFRRPRVAAFVQDDATGEVLQAAQTELAGP